MRCFEPGADMELVWLPVDDGLKHAGRVAVGGPDDRDDVHRVDRGILYAREKGWLWGFLRELQDPCRGRQTDDPVRFEPSKGDDGPGSVDADESQRLPHPEAVDGRTAQQEGSSSC